MSVTQTKRPQALDGRQRQPPAEQRSAALQQREDALQQWEDTLSQRQTELDEAISNFRQVIARSAGYLGEQRQTLDKDRAALEQRIAELDRREARLVELAQRARKQAQALEETTTSRGRSGAEFSGRPKTGGRARPESAAPFHGRKGRLRQGERPQPTHTAWDDEDDETEEPRQGDEVLAAANDQSSKEELGVPPQAGESPVLEDGDDEGTLIVRGGAVMTPDGRMLTPEEAAGLLVEFGIVSAEEVTALRTAGYSPMAILADHLAPEEEGAQNVPASRARPGSPPTAQSAGSPPPRGHMYDEDETTTDGDDLDYDYEEFEEEEQHIQLE